MTSRLILNGRSAGLPAVRSAVQQVRDSGIKLDVRVTYEGGDGMQLAQEACHDGVERIIVGGGGGSIHEVTNGMMSAGTEQLPMLGIMPLGTANDFATACSIPRDLFQALYLAVTGDARMVDVGRANERYFLNAASGSFGGAVNAATPAAVKKILGGAAQSLLGMVMAANFQPHDGVVVLPDRKRKVRGVIAAVSNGSQAGGGQPVAPQARIDDGLLDVLVVREFPLRDLGVVIDELQNLKSKGRYVSYHQVPWLEVVLEGKMPINLDGEATALDSVRFEIMPGALPLVLPQDCPLVSPLEVADLEEADDR